MIRQDLDLNFLKNPITGDVNIKRSEEAVKQSVKVLLLTALYEKPFNNDLGADLNSFLFENYILGNNEKIVERIRLVLNAYEPSINIKNLYAEKDVRDNQVKIFLEYYYTGNNINTMSLVLERSR
jgi:phage baseplate assembly protein W